MPRSSKPKKVIARRTHKNVIARSAATRQSDRTPEHPPPTLFKAGLPITAYAIREDEFDVSTWQLPHHKPDKSVDMEMMEICTRLLSRWGFNGSRCIADPALIIDAARHLADHYRAAGQQPPVALCVLI
jgi:hypothetical protein